MTLLWSRTDGRSYEAERYRLKGTLMLQSEVRSPKSLIPDPQVEAEVCLHKAIEIARQQSAKSWELRAVRRLDKDLL